MPRILVLNNYSFERVWGEIRAGDKPDHHLYGLNHFVAAGYNVELMSDCVSSGWIRSFRWLQRIGFPIPLGDLDQQAAVLQRQKQADLIYAPCQTETHLLGYLRRFGLLKLPLVCLAHHPMEVGRLKYLRRPFVRANLRGTDRYPSLSRKVAGEINQLSGRQISEPMPWGPEKGYYEVAMGPGEGVVAAGRTGRDFVTFGRAATHVGTNARIICLKSSVTSEFRQFGPKVLVEAYPDEQPLGYRELTRAFAAARVLAIPMSSGDNLAGLTSLTDALGVGRPVIITRNQQMDLDVEALGIGRWVEPYDQEGWVKAIRWFDEHPNESMAMGHRARALVDGGLHSEAFARRIMALFDQVLNEASRRTTK